MELIVKKKVFFPVVFLLISTALSGQVRKYSNEFLSIGVGARALGMSNAYVSTTNDVTSGYWNPAGLARMNSDLQVSLMHAEYFAGIAKYDYGAFATKIDSVSSVGVSLIRFGVDDIPNTTELIDTDGNINYDRITSFSAADYGFLFSYARKSPIKGLNYGANVKVIHRIVGDFAKAWGFGLDAGAQYKYKKWRFGAMARDVTSTFNAWNFTLSDRVKEVFTVTGNEIPENSLEITLPKLILAGGREFKITERFSALGELDFDMTFDGMRNVLIKSDPISIAPHFGFEVDYMDIIYLRGGIGNFQQVENVSNQRTMTFQPNFGVGVSFKGFSLDYALTDIGDRSVALYSNIFSLKIDINKNN